MLVSNAVSAQLRAWLSARGSLAGECLFKGFDVTSLAGVHGFLDPAHGCGSMLIKPDYVGCREWWVQPLFSLAVSVPR
jgi:hypothetical protein